MPGKRVKDEQSGRVQRTIDSSIEVQMSGTPAGHSNLMPGCIEHLSMHDASKFHVIPHQAVQQRCKLVRKHLPALDLWRQVSLPHMIHEGHHREWHLLQQSKV